MSDQVTPVTSSLPAGSSSLISPLQNDVSSLSTANIANTMPPVTTQQATGAAQKATNFSAGEQPYLLNQQQNLTQQSGIPQIQSQYGNLSQVFQMWQADKNLSQQYANPSLNSPNSAVFQGNLSPSNTSWNSNPYLNQSPSQILQQTAGTFGGNFQGFSTPGALISAVGEVPTAVNSLLSGLSNLYSGTSNLVQNQLGVAQNKYETQANLLNEAANLLTGANTTQTNASNAAGPGGYAVGSPDALQYTMQYAVGPNLPPGATKEQQIDEVQQLKKSLMQYGKDFYNSVLKEAQEGNIVGTSKNYYKGTKETQVEANATAAQTSPSIISQTLNTVAPALNFGSTQQTNPAWQANGQSPYTIISVGK
jgi:hypothetical protein